MRKIISLVSVVLSLLLFVTSCSFSGNTDVGIHTASPDELEKNVYSGTAATEYRSIATDGKTELLFRESDAAIAIKSGDEYWYSNPTDIDTDPYASGPIRDRMLSQIILHYYNADLSLKTMCTYADSIKNKQYRIEEIEKGIRVIFTLGSFERGVESIPKRLSDERMQSKFIQNDKLTSSEQRWIKKYYRLDGEVWNWKDNDSSMVIKRMLELMDKSGYTEQDLEKDNSDMGMTADDSNRVAFQICVEYSLENEKLKVTVPMEHFKYMGKVEPSAIEVLNYFGAAENSDEGYMLVPDGSGALINLRSASDTSDVFCEEVYGDGESASEIRLPVFGIKSGSKAYLANINKGDAIAKINAIPSAIYSKYNSVFATFTLKKNEYATLGDAEEQTEVMNFQSNMYSSDIELQYSFLTGNKANYVGMAEAYRNILSENKAITKLDENTVLPMTLETLGSVNKTKSFLAIKYSGMSALTEFNENLELIKRFSDAGINKINLDMLYWCNSGYEQTLAKKISPLSVLGGNGALKELLKNANDGTHIGGVISLSEFSASSSGSIYKYAAKRIDQSFFSKDEKDIAAQKVLEKGKRYFLSPLQLSKTVESLAKSVKGYEDINLTVSGAGEYIVADYGKKNCTDREIAKALTVDALKKLSEKVNIRIWGGNVYAVPYTDTVSHAPEASSKNSTIDRTIPFYSMVFHGYLYMSGKPINYQKNPEIELLQCIENGYGITACCMYADSDELKDTKMSAYFSAGINDSFESSAYYFKQASDAIGDLAGVVISDHIIYSDELSCTVYENGIKIYVNYGLQDAVADGVKVPAMSYQRVE